MPDDVPPLTLLCLYRDLFASEGRFDRQHAHKVACKRAEWEARMFPLARCCPMPGCGVSLWDADTWTWADRCFECGWERERETRGGESYGQMFAVGGEG
jgi:hypothetical protein